MWTLWSCPLMLSLGRPSPSQSEAGSEGTNIIGWGPASVWRSLHREPQLTWEPTISCKYYADTAQWTLTALQHDAVVHYGHIRRTKLNVLWSETITEVKMMSMKVPSNEEIKKWNVDQVQEFLAQVDTLINKHLFKNVRGKHILQQNLTIFSLHDYTYRLWTWRGLKYSVWHD